MNGGLRENRESPPSGKLADHLVWFARALRGAGLTVGPGAALDALDAVTATPLTSRDDFRVVLQAVFVKAHGHMMPFDQVFALFWQQPGFLEQIVGGLSPEAEPQDERAVLAAARVPDALSARRDDQETPAPRLDLAAAFTTSGKDVSRAKDFTEMSVAERGEAMAMIARLRLPRDERPTRRFEADPRGSKVDPRRSFRRLMRGGGTGIELVRRTPAAEPTPIVALCDISGSVAAYSRVVLHFLHALSARREVHSFLFGTRLTNVSRALAIKDADEALAACGASVRDWAGGTRIADSLHLFNKVWLRRVAGRSAIVILFTDGLERDGIGGLSHEVARIQRSCRRLIWLNPLLRYDGFEAKAAGIRAMLPFVDEFRPIHNLEAVGDLCQALAERPPGRRGRQTPACPDRMRNAR